MYRSNSYLKFKRKAREHQIHFREKNLCVDFCIYPNVLFYDDAIKGIIFYEEYRDDILKFLQKPVLKTSSSPSPQMLTNLLRSEHIPYNIFFPMKYDLFSSVNLLNNILGRKQISKIIDIFIEYHPEPIEKYLFDHTAFDVYIPYIDFENNLCGIGIEIKYTEKEYPLKIGSREYNNVKNEKGETALFRNYLDATIDSEYFKEPISYDELISNKFRQIWRNHILGASMVLNGDIKTFSSITIFPKANTHFYDDAIPKYKELLSDKGLKSFIALTYEDLFDLMEKSFEYEKSYKWIKYLRERYLFQM